MRESQARIINGTAILLAAICAGGLGWAFGFVCGGILNRPNREKVDAEIKTYQAQVAAAQAMETEARGKLQAQMKKIIGLQKDRLQQHERIKTLEEAIEQQAAKDAGSGESAESGPLGETRIAGGFSYRNVHFRSSFGATEAIGEITNRGGRGYDATVFKVSVYDKEKRLLGTGAVLVNSFIAGQTRSFEAGIETRRSAIDSFKIDLETALNWD